MSEFLVRYGSVLVAMVVSSLLALSLYLPLMTGQLSLASPGFYALGGYIAAIISTRYMPFDAATSTYTLIVNGSRLTTFGGPAYPLSMLLVEMALGGVAAGLLALVVGIPALRLRGIYLALATIAFVEIVRNLSLNLPITGGAIGIPSIPQPFPNPQSYLELLIPMLILVALFVFRLERVRTGRALIALREDELAAASMGINPTTSKVLAFVLGAVVAGMVGAVNAHVLNTWNARQGTFDVSIATLACVLIGGSRTFLGPIVGGLVLTALPEVLRQIGSPAAGSEALLPVGIRAFLLEGRLIIYGVLIVLCTIFFPQGLITPKLLGMAPKRPGRPKGGPTAEPKAVES